VTQDRSDSLIQMNFQIFQLTPCRNSPRKGENHGTENQ
jgi:hypothetical protein